MDLSSLKNSSSGHDSKQAERNDVQGAKPARRLLCCCFAFYIVYLLWFSLPRKSNSKAILPCFDGQIQWLQEQKQWKDICPKAESWRREKHIPFHCFLPDLSALACVSFEEWIPYSDNLLYDPHSNGCKTLMGDTCWIDTAKEVLESEGGKVCVLLSLPWKKSQCVVTGYFLNQRDMVTKSLILC